jgi:hypothetical protein
MLLLGSLEFCRYKLPVIKVKQNNLNKNMSSFFKSLVKSIKFPLLILMGLLLAGFESGYPEIWQMSLGSLMILLYDQLKHYFGLKLP